MRFSFPPRAGKSLGLKRSGGLGLLPSYCIAERAERGPVGVVLGGRSVLHFCDGNERAGGDVGEIDVLGIMFESGPAYVSTVEISLNLPNWL